MTDAPDILLTVTLLRPDEKLLLAALRNEGLRVQVALREDLADVVSARVEPPAVAMIRNLSHADAVSTARRLENLGVPTVNRSASIEICNDKGLQALAFGRYGVPHPRSAHAFSIDQVRTAVAEVGWPAVVKPVSGSWGRGVTRLLDEHCLEAWAGGREGVDAAGKLFPVLVQEYVDKPGHDLRVIVVGRRPIVAIERVSDDWRTNTHLGAQVRRVEITGVIEKLCTRAVDILGDGFYGIDLLPDRSTGELTVLEVNANPEFAKSSAVHGVDVARHLAEYLADQVRSKSEPAAA